LDVQYPLAGSDTSQRSSASISSTLENLRLGAPEGAFAISLSSIFLQSV